MKLAVIVGFPREGGDLKVIGKPGILPAVTAAWKSSQADPAVCLTYERIELWSNGTHKYRAAKLRKPVLAVVSDQSDQSDGDFQTKGKKPKARE